MGFGTRAKMVDPPPFNPAVGVTASDRYLEELYKRSFLSLWRYPGIPSHSLEQIVSVVGQRISPSPGVMPEKRPPPGGFVQTAFSETGILQFPHSEKQLTGLRPDRDGRNLLWAMIGPRENAASYDPKSSMVLSEARREAWVRGSGQVSDDVCWQQQRSRSGDCKVSRLGPRSPHKEKTMAKKREKRECELFEKRGCYVKEVCDRCGTAIHYANRFSIRGEAGVSCSRECGDG